MTTPRVSVIALTRDRSEEFLSLLHALRQQRMRDFEVIVVGAEPSALAHGATRDFADRLVYLQCVDQNISMSRNIGLSAARGEIVAFIDDDAAPEPDWLDEALKVFAADDIGAVGGFVRGRNGVDFQWRGALVDHFGAHRELTAEDLMRQDLNDPESEAFLSTVGVNSVFRRDALYEIGGFDENLHYFLDESDVCFRLLKAGWRTALAPRAEVHHSYSESSERSANRAPRDLFQVAASRVYFALTHGGAEWVEGNIERFEDDQVERLRKFVQLGRISRRQSEQVEERMREGFEEGRARFDAGAKVGATLTGPNREEAGDLFINHDRARRPRVALVVTDAMRTRMNDVAERLVEAGCEVTLLDFQFSGRRLRVRFDRGVWRHVGGILGRDYFGAPPAPPRRCLRIKREVQRLSDRRDFDVIIHPNLRKYRLGDLPMIPVGAMAPKFVAEPLRPGAAEGVVGFLNAPAMAP
ncbi:MAG: glycosyltransferase family 2 protein [Pseudomonadota bacterium]